MSLASTFVLSKEQRLSFRESISSAKVNAADSSGWTALALAVLRRLETDVIRLLLDLGADPDLECETGDTPMSLAIEEDWEYVVLELAWHADPTFVSTKGDSALSIAKWFGNSRIVNRLESMGFRDTNEPTSYEKENDLLNS